MPEIRERLNLYLTKPVADELRRLIPPRERTRFVEEVLARELRRKKLLEALDKSYGAWKDEDHPELATFDDVNRWIEEGRKGFTRDFSEEWGKDG
ncbi:MAG: hypothetical protein FJZ96_00290 [Chloroflexi bacterium]|nr:hypothetical protein [Chloroflexota bacterium]